MEESADTATDAPSSNTAGAGENAAGQLAEQQAWIDRSLSTDLTGPVVIDALSIGQVKDLQAKLLARIQASDEVQLDLSAVDALDTAGLQLLVAFNQEAMRRGRKVKFLGAKETLSVSLALLGLQPQIAVA